jgi:tetratricopeptide (TPR) repeat protein
MQSSILQMRLDFVREMRILLPRAEYIPGEKVSGTLILNCDEHFKCQNAELSLAGNINYIHDVYKRQRGGYKTKKGVRSWVTHKDTFRLGKDIEYDAGTYEIPFQFQLPTDLLPSYSSNRFVSSYFVYSKMDISKKPATSTIRKLVGQHSEEPALRASKDLIVHSPMTESPEEITKATGHLFENALEIKIDSQKHGHGEELSFWYKINTDMEFKELCVEIEHTEHWKGNHILSEDIRNQSTESLRTIPAEKVVRHEWTRVVQSIPLLQSSFSFNYFKSSYLLKVKLVRKLKQGDIIARIPLFVGLLLKPDWREKLEAKYARRNIFKPIAATEKDDFFQHWYNRALAFWKERAIEAAIRSIDKALEIRPDNADALALRDELQKLAN